MSEGKLYKRPKVALVEADLVTAQVTIWQNILSQNVTYLLVRLNQNMKSHSVFNY